MKAALAKLRLAPAPDSTVSEALRQGKSPWSEAVHLLWSVWVFITPMFGGGYTSKWLWLTLASYPVFLWLYAKVLVASRRVAYRYALGMIALSIALVPFYLEGMSYFVFGCVMLRTSSRRSLPVYLVQVLALNAVFLALAWWAGYPWQALAWLPAVTLVIGIIVNVERASQEKDAALKLSHEEVRRLAATAERERIGRDLHDLLGHTLSLITLKLELARKLSERDPPASRRELEEAERVARHALAEVRSAVTGIRSTDLAAELASARLMLESSQVHLEYDLPPGDVPPEVERGLALVLREAVTNIARHARASRARIEFACDGKVLQLSIVDDGRGGVGADGNGIGGMRDRVRALGGTLSIESPRGGGSRLLVRVPAGSTRTVFAPVAMADPTDVAAMPQARA
ncbi:sensor histidine kinase [Lysobacter sp. CFH 32150]|uniref:sensor histidine kinase n=1 Tax=Lysobacter sp. CFH 32150 TaxID=2927128 RepID=UPI001FA73600|nr:sensor histidine kinase [Lysobacter sp. CFH 32150]MCI4568221.1 sensor histidine kinase [Lysobacter sp. CFH 32150]